MLGGGLLMVSGKGIVATLEGGGIDTTSSVATFTLSIDIGTADPAGKKLVAASVLGSWFVLTSITGVTIDGVTATEAVGTAASIRPAGIWYANVGYASGSVDIVVTINAARSANFVAVKAAAIHGWTSATPNSTDQDQDTGRDVNPLRSVTLSPDAGSVAVAAYQVGAMEESQTAVWTGVDSEANNFTLLNDFREQILAVAITENTGTSLTITATEDNDTTGNYPVLIAASWK